MPAPRGLMAPAGDLLDLLAHRLRGDPQQLQRLSCYPAALKAEAEQDVLGTDVIVVEHPGLLLSQDHNPPRPVGEPLEHAPPPSSASSWAVPVANTIHLVSRFRLGCVLESLSAARPRDGADVRHGIRRRPVRG